MDEFLDAPGAISRRDLFRLTLGGGWGSQSAGSSTCRRCVPRRRT